MKENLQDFVDLVKLHFPESCFRAHNTTADKIAREIQAMAQSLKLTQSPSELVLQEIPYFMVFGCDSISTGYRRIDLGKEAYNALKYVTQIIAQLYKCEAVDDIEYVEKKDWGKIIKFSYFGQLLFIAPNSSEGLELKTYVYAEDYSCYTFHEPIRHLYPFYTWNREASIMDEVNSMPPI